MWCGEFGSAGTENGQFMGIEGIQVAHNGDIIICDRENHRIQIFWDRTIQEIWILSSPRKDLKIIFYTFFF